MATWSSSAEWTPRRTAASAHQSVVPFQMFRASDGWLVIACAKQSLWVRLCEALARPDLAADARFADMTARSRNREELVGVLEQLLSERTVSDWVVVLGEHDVPCAPVNSIREALADPQIHARALLAAYEHPVLGRVETIRSALGSEQTRPVGRAPFLGENTAEVLASV